MCGAFSPHDRSHVFQACRPSTSCRNSSSLVRSPSPKPIFKIYKIFKTFKILKILKVVELIFIYINQTPKNSLRSPRVVGCGIFTIKKQIVNCLLA